MATADRPVAVSDSSPLILYARIGRLDLLSEHFSQVIVPPAVWHEVVIAGCGRSGADAVGRSRWLVRRELEHDSLARALSKALGRGEAEAIALKIEIGGHGPLLLDDRRARRVAHEHGAPVTGSAVIQILAKERDLISAVHPVLDALRDVGLYLSDEAARELLTTAREWPPIEPD